MINILITYVSLKNNFLKFVLTNIVSVLENNKKNTLKFYIMNFHLSDSERTTLINLITEYNQEYQFIETLEKEEQRFLETLNSYNNSTYSNTMFYRLIFPKLKLASNIDRVLYLDAGDVIVHGDLKEFYNLNLENNILAGHKDDAFYIRMLKEKHSLHELDPENYVNSGVLLMNIKQIRKTDFYQEIIKIVEKYNGNFSLMDQDILNILFKNKITFVNDKIIKILFDRVRYKVYEKALIYHYTGNSLFLRRSRFGKYYKRKYYTLYYYYLDKTIFKGWRPPYKWVTKLNRKVTKRTKAFQIAIHLRRPNISPKAHRFAFQKKENTPFQITNLKNIKVSQLIINASSIRSDIPAKTIHNELVWHDQLLEEPIGLHWTFARFSKKKLANFMGGKEKTNLCLNAVKVLTDTDRRGDKPINRNRIIRNLENNGFQNQDLTLKEYFDIIQKTKFVISPEGNGIDCHRHYEAWIAGAIPIIEKNPLMEKKYKGLPVLLTEDYSEITTEYLEKKYIEITKKTYDYSRLCLDYYPFPIQQKIVARTNYWLKRLIKQELKIK